MRRRDLYFRAIDVQHICQRIVDRGVIFYDELDRLVYYMTVSVVSRKYNVEVLLCSIMFTHVHLSLRASSLLILEKFMQDSASMFARAYNKRYKRHGDLFDKPFLRSDKSGPKEIRNNLAYVANNHVEKQLCHLAQQERWSLIAYLNDKHPFSEPIDYLACSKELLSALKRVKMASEEAEVIRYQSLERLLGPLNETEREQLIDYLIATYALLDPKLAVSYYSGYDEMVRAFEATTGGEWGFKEERAVKTDIPYRRMCNVLSANPGLVGESIYKLSDQEKAELAMKFSSECQATAMHLKKFLHAEL